eukprot:4971804-Prymnesium_polylepis.1
MRRSRRPFALLTEGAEGASKQLAQSQPKTCRSPGWVVTRERPGSSVCSPRFRAVCICDNASLTVLPLSAGGTVAVTNTSWVPGAREMWRTAYNSSPTGLDPSHFSFDAIIELSSIPGTGATLRIGIGCGVFCLSALRASIMASYSSISSWRSSSSSEARLQAGLDGGSPNGMLS